MTPAAQETLTHRLTHRDLDYTPDDGNRYEIIDGDLYVSPFPSFLHQRIVSRLLHLLMAWVIERGLGEVVAPGLKVVLDEPTGVGPDIAFISSDRMEAMRPDGFYGAPDLLVEVTSSKPQLDRFVKFHKYAAAGVRHYWIIDPEKGTLEAFRLVGEKYDLVPEKTKTDTFEPELFPGLAIRVQDLWY